jgi:hypothetical protein
VLRPNASRRDAAEPGRVESPGEARPLADRLLEGGWLSLVLLVPLVMNPWGQSIFSLPKAIALRAVVMALIAAWGAHNLLVGRSMRLRSRRTVLALPAVGLIVAISLATIFARAPALSLWGSHGRSEGALTLVCLPILALLVSARLPGVDGARRIFVAASATVLPLTAYASLQLWGPDPLGIVTDARSPIFATLGRSNFLGSYLAMLIPLSLTLVALAKRPALKVAAVALGALELILLIATQARAGWLAAFVGVSCWAGLLFRDRIKALAQSTTARAVTVTASAVIAAVALWLAQTGATGAGRLAIWQGTL